MRKLIIDLCDEIGFRADHIADALQGTWHRTQYARRGSIVVGTRAPLGDIALATLARRNPDADIRRLRIYDVVRPWADGDGLALHPGDMPPIPIQPVEYALIRALLGEIFEDRRDIEKPLFVDEDGLELTPEGVRKAKERATEFIWTLTEGPRPL